jgi:hypothetical protein
MTVAVIRNILDRWIIVDAARPGLAWSGWQWVEHVDGIGLTVQVIELGQPEGKRAPMLSTPAGR